LGAPAAASGVERTRCGARYGWVVPLLLLLPAAVLGLLCCCSCCCGVWAAVELLNCLPCLCYYVISPGHRAYLGEAIQGVGGAAARHCCCCPAAVAAAATTCWCRVLLLLLWCISVWQSKGTFQEVLMAGICRSRQGRAGHKQAGRCFGYCYRSAQFQERGMYHAT
jgi:hypothetical protein